ncbi:MAG: hypothetical protein AAFY88_22180, partial [Acidobacteriota bacterium]
MKLTTSVFSTLLLLSTIPVAAETAADAAAGPLQRDVFELAAPALEGRMTGTDGARKAAAYIVAELEALGAVPLPGQDSL